MTIFTRVCLISVSDNKHPCSILKRDYLNVNTDNTCNIQAIRWAGVIQWTGVPRRHPQHLSVPSRYDALESSSGSGLNVNTMSDQCVMSSQSRHQLGKIWDDFVFAARWRKVKRAFWQSLSTAIGSSRGWIHTFFMNLLLQRLSAFIKDILGPTRLYPILRTVEKPSFKKAPDWITSTHNNWLFY